MTLSQGLRRTALGVMAISVLLATVAYQAEVVINTTPSLPLGLYRAVNAPLARGAYVKFCPPQSPAFDVARRRGYLGAGFCPGGYAFMIKRMAAGPGDQVAVTHEGVIVNGRLLAMSAPMRTDGDGRFMPSFTQDRALTGSELLLMSDVSRVSFDARYFGPLDRAQVRAVVEPIFTW
jgi:conjugative transfer signal peptidase TraF